MLRVTDGCATSCGAVVISLAQTGVSILYIADPKIGQAASEEAARQEDVMAALAEKALHVLWQLQALQQLPTRPRDAVAELLELL